MRLKDPLATLKFLGGGIFYQVMMLAYAIIISNITVQHMECGTEEETREFRHSFRDISYMKWIHGSVVALELSSKTFRTMNGGYLKSILSNARGFIYLAGLCLIIFGLVKMRE